MGKAHGERAGGRKESVGVKVIGVRAKEKGRVDPKEAALFVAETITRISAHRDSKKEKEKV